jgi:hypothetical protein
MLHIQTEEAFVQHKELLQTGWLLNKRNKPKGQIFNEKKLNVTGARLQYSP